MTLFTILPPSFLIMWLELPEPKTVLAWLAVAIVVLWVLYLIELVLENSAIVTTRSWNAGAHEGHLYYHLPKGMIKINSTVMVEVKRDAQEVVVSARRIRQSFETEPMMVADAEHRYGLSYVQHSFANDELTLKTNNQGLLESVNAIAEDRFPQITQVVSAAPAVIFSTRQEAARLLAGEEAGGEVIEVKREFIVDPDSDTTEQNWIITDPDWSPTITVDAGFKISSKEFNKNEGSELKRIDEFDGILVRPMKAHTFNIEVTNKLLQTENSQFVMDLPDRNAILHVPLCRSSFVKRQQDIKLTDGLLTSHKINKPSQVEAFVQMPVNVLKVIVSIPAQLLSFKFDNTQKQNALATEMQKLEATILAGERERQTRDLKNQEELLKAQQGLKLAQQGLKTIEELAQKVKLLEEKIKPKTQ